MNEATHTQEKIERGRSAIKFPYSNLQEALDLVEVLAERAGIACERAQLAAWLGLSETGGSFRSRYNAAVQFKLISTIGEGRVKVTELGLEAISKDSRRELRARVIAFKNVELFSRLYELRKGHPLPTNQALENMIKECGVTPKQAERARQTFMKSAITARFIEQEGGRLIEPGINSTEVEEHYVPPQDNEDDSVDESQSSLDLDPIIKGLLEKLPPPGQEWSEDQRKLWLGLLENTFRLIYKEPVKLLTPPSEES